MKSREIISALRKQIQKHGIDKVATDLGYQSVGTVYTWFRNNQVPRLARDRAMRYLSAHKKK